MSAYVEVDNVRKAFVGRQGLESVLDGVSFNLNQGETLGICGRSGVGKSTLLRIVAGLLQPDSGAVRIKGQDPKSHYPKIGFVGQDYSRSLLPWFRVDTNVSLGILNSGQSANERRRLAINWLDEVGLQDAAKKYPWQLSGGMQQRVAIARALATRPTLLCLDEPFGALDAQTRMELQDLILTLSRKHSITNVLVTHDLDEAVYMSDKILILLGPKGESRNIEVPLSYPREQIQTRQEKSFLELRALLGSEISPKH